MRVVPLAFALVALLTFNSATLNAQWVQSGPYGGTIFSFAVSGTNLFAGTHFGGVFRSPDNGTTWTAVNNGLTDPVVRALAVSGTNVFAGTFGGVFLSTNNGTSWTAVNNGLIDLDVHALAVSPAGGGSGTNLFAGTLGGGVFLSTDNGTSWTEVNSGLTSLYVQAFAVSDTNVFAGTYGGVFLSTNYGTSWSAVNTGLTNPDIFALAISADNLFAGTWGGGLWRRPLSDMITSVQVLSTSLPAQFSLSQNYPNPFNPATTISFSLPLRSFVSLKVFDALGREVSTLVSEELAAGTYRTQWDAAGLPSGVYFYRLLAHPTSGGQAGSFMETRKLILLR